MEMTSTIYAKGRLKDVTNNYLYLNRSNSRVECGSLCLVREMCHFYSWYEDTKKCDMDYVDQGWHFNYTEMTSGTRSIYVDTGTLGERQKTPPSQVPRC